MRVSSGAEVIFLDEGLQKYMTFMIYETSIYFLFINKIGFLTVFTPNMISKGYLIFCLVVVSHFNSVTDCPLLIMSVSHK